MTNLNHYKIYEYADFVEKPILEEDFDAPKRLHNEQNEDYELRNRKYLETMKEYIKNELNINIPKNIELIMNDVRRLYLHEIDSCIIHSDAAFCKSDFYMYRFMIDLIETYHLDSFQVAVLYWNKDLFNYIYHDKQISKLFNLDTKLCEGKTTNKLINNLKLLVNDNCFQTITLNLFAYLRDNYIFFQDNQKILDKYPNVTVSDLLKLCWIDMELFEQYVSLLNSVDEDLKMMLLYIIEPLKNNNNVFPNLVDEIGYTSSKEPFSRSIEIIEKNEYIYANDNYNKLFFNIFNLEDLCKILNMRNRDDIIKTIFIIKKVFTEMIPEKFDNRYKVPIYNNQYTEVEKYEHGCGEYEQVSYTKFERHKTIGHLDTREDLVKIYIDLIISIKSMIIDNDNFTIEQLFKINCDSQLNSFLGNIIKQYLMEQNSKENIKTKKRN